MRCRGCDVELVASNWPASRRAKGEYWCRKCLGTKRQRWREMHRERDRLNQRNWLQRNRSRILEQRRLRTLKLKLKVFAHYGTACQCCGQTGEAFLTIDHVNNGGDKHRRELFGTNTGGSAFYRWLVKQNYPKEYQLLCWNCNCGRRINGGICPHRESVSATNRCCAGQETK
jgi:hypothetical protein